MFGSVLSVPFHVDKPPISSGLSMTTTYTPSFLDAILKAEIIGFLEDYEDDIAESYDEAQRLFIDALSPLWEAQMRVNEEVEESYSARVGTSAVVAASDLVTSIMSLLVPVFMRPQRFLDDLPEEAQDQLPNQHVNYNLSQLTDIPMPLLMPTQFDDDGSVTSVFDMVVEDEDGNPKTTEWAVPAILSLTERGVDVPEELCLLVTPDDYV